MDFIRKHSKEISFLFIITLAYFATRLVSLTDVPIFTDEAIYLRWAQIANSDANWRFISLTDGKQPLFIWLVMISMRFFSDPLIAGRVVSVAAGFVTMAGLFFLGRELFKNRWVGIVSAGIYAIFPFALVYDRLALYDSLVGTFTVWGLYISVLVIRSLRLDLAFILGFVTGAAVLNKTNGFFTLGLFPFMLLLFDWKKHALGKRILTVGGLFLMVVVLTFGFYTILRLSPYFYLIAEKNTIFVYPLKEWIQHPFAHLGPNVQGLLDWFVRYMTLPFIFSLIAAFFLDKKYVREKILLFLFFILPFTYLAFFGNTIYPRYLFSMTLSLLPLVAYTMVIGSWRIKNVLGVVAFVLVLVFFPIYTDGKILTDFAHAAIPKSDRGQLYTDWPAGAGINESLEFFKQKQREHGEIFIGTAGTFGLMPYAYEIYFPDPRSIVKGYWPIESSPPQELIEKSKTMPTYMVFYQTCVLCGGKGKAPDSWNVKEVFRYQKIAPDATLSVYEIKPQ